MRRRSGLPTVSLLLTASEPAAFGLEHFFEASGFISACSTANDAPTIACDWLQALEARHDVAAEALAFAALSLATPERALRAALQTKSDCERTLWLDQHASEGTQPLRAALQALAPRTESLDAVSRLYALMGWWPEREHLLLILMARYPAALRAALRLAADRPELPVLVLMRHEAWRGSREQLDARSRRLFEADAIPVLPPASWSQTRSDAAPVLETRLSHAVETTQHAPRLAPNALNEPSFSARHEHDTVLAKRAADAIADAKAGAENGRIDDVLAERARSQAEQRLFELLQQEPATRGLFELNRELPFTFGGRKAEIDLVCVELRLALEVDGYYHFQNNEAYRRDRRKDVLLQHQGYLISRHLADDVVERAHEVLISIRRLVLRRRRWLERENHT